MPSLFMNIFSSRFSRFHNSTWLIAVHFFYIALIDTFSQRETEFLVLSVARLLFFLIKLFLASSHFPSKSVLYFN